MSSPSQQASQPPASWAGGASGLISVCGFLAGISATILVLILTRVEASTFRDLSLFLFVLALCVFALAAEKFTDAIDYRNCGAYVLGIVWYNAAITIFLIGLMMILYVVNFQIGAFVPALFSAYWAKDVVWLLSSSRRKEFVESLKAASVEYMKAGPGLLVIGWFPIVGALVNVSGSIGAFNPLVIISTAYMAAGGILLITRDYEDGLAITILGSIMSSVLAVVSLSWSAFYSALLAILGILLACTYQKLKEKTH